MNAKVEVFHVNQAFYDAFNRQDLDAMKAVWSEAEGVACLHPGWPVLRGHDRIIDSWGGIFENTDHMEIKLSNTDVLVEGSMGWVSCQENLFSIHAQGVQQSAVHATNLFRKENGVWKMILHHAGPIPQREQE